MMNLRGEAAMPLDLASDFSAPKRARGAMAHARGVAGEEQVKRHYERRGAQCIAQRWRGQAGEIDLVFRHGQDIICVEVKASRTHARAAEMLRPQQMQRLCLAAEEFLGTLPTGSLTPMRFDVALLDDRGEIDIVENALMSA